MSFQGIKLERRGKAPLAVVGLAMAFAMTGCGSSHTASSTSQNTASSETAAPAAIIGACDLLTQGIAIKFIGASAQRTMNAQPNPHMTHCHYNSSEGSIDVIVSDNWSMISVGQEHVPGEKPMAGLGDEAHINPTSLRVRKGTHGMEITATGPAGEYSGAAADAQLAHGEALSVEVAKALLPRL
jgi:hypothetical protein